MDHVKNTARLLVDNLSTYQISKQFGGLEHADIETLINPTFVHFELETGGNQSNYIEEHLLRNNSLVDIGDLPSNRRQTSASNFQIFADYEAIRKNTLVHLQHRASIVSKFSQNDLAMAYQDTVDQLYQHMDQNQDINNDFVEVDVQSMQTDGQSANVIDQSFLSAKLKNTTMI